MCSHCLGTYMFKVGALFNFITVLCFILIELMGGVSFDKCSLFGSTCSKCQTDSVKQ